MKKIEQTHGPLNAGKMAIHLLLVIAFMTLDLPIKAQTTEYESIKITFTDDTNVVLPIFDSTCIIPDEEEFVIALDLEQTSVYHYDYGNIKCITYEPATFNSVTQIENNDSIFHIEENYLIINQPAEIVIINLDGIIQIHFSVSASHKEYDLSNLREGVYILVVNGKTYKFYKK